VQVPTYIEFLVFPEEDGGFSAQSMSFGVYGIYTQGDSEEELITNIEDATELVFGELPEVHLLYISSVSILEHSTRPRPLTSLMAPSAIIDG
jgi:predicted RNase H-like HicB family nuclease